MSDDTQNAVDAARGEMHDVFGPMSLRRIEALIDAKVRAIVAEEFAARDAKEPLWGGYLKDEPVAAEPEVQMMQASRQPHAFYPHGSGGHSWSSWCGTFDCQPEPAPEPQAPRWCEMPGCGKGEYAHHGPCRPPQMMQANERYRGMVHGEVHVRLSDCGLMTPCIPVPVEQPKDIAVKCVLCGQPEHWGKRCEPPNPHPMTLEQARQPDGMIVPCQTCIAIPCVCGAEGVRVASQPTPPPKDVAPVSCKETGYYINEPI